MTLQDFYRELEAHKHKFEWSLDNEAIRGDAADCLDACPITSLVREDRLGWRDAADSLGMSEDLIDRILDAADFHKSDYPEIRERLLDILGLEEANE